MGNKWLEQLASTVYVQPCVKWFSSFAECLVYSPFQVKVSVTNPLQMFSVACLPDRYVYISHGSVKIPSDVSGSQKTTCAHCTFDGEKERAAGLCTGAVFVRRWEDSCLGSHFSAYLSCSNCRWPTADPERNHFSACVHASLPQATHPEGKTPPVFLPQSSCSSYSAGCWSAAGKIWRWSALPAQFIHSAPGNVCAWIKISCAETNLMESLVKRAVMNKWLVW